LWLYEEPFTLVTFEPIVKYFFLQEGASGDGDTSDMLLLHVGAGGSDSGSEPLVGDVDRIYLGGVTS
jgi:hypothetical protein